jgi:hypothetical protein
MVHIILRKNSQGENELFINYFRYLNKRTFYESIIIYFAILGEKCFSPKKACKINEYALGSSTRKLEGVFALCQGFVKFAGKNQ